MNLNEFSEKHNKEFGIFIDPEIDYGIYEDVIAEIRSLISTSQLKKKSQSVLKGFKSFVVIPLEIEDFCNFLNTTYGVRKFTLQKNYFSDGNWELLVTAQEFIQNVNIEIDRNIDFTINLPTAVCEKIFHISKILRNSELLQEYRVYWNPPYHIIKVYNSLSMRERWNLLDNQDKFKYKKRAIDIVISELKQDIQNIVHVH